MEPARFHIRQSQRLITGQAGLVLAGQALARFAQLPQQLDRNRSFEGVLPGLCTAP